MVWPQSLHVLKQRLGKYKVSTREKKALFCGQGAGSVELVVGLERNRVTGEGKEYWDKGPVHPESERPQKLKEDGLIQSLKHQDEDQRGPRLGGQNSGWKSLSTLEVSPCQLHTGECDRARGGGAGTRAHSSGFPLHGCKGNETTHQGTIILPSPSSGPRKLAVYSDPRDFAQDVPSTKESPPFVYTHLPDGSA